MTVAVNDVLSGVQADSGGALPGGDVGPMLPIDGLAGVSERDKGEEGIVGRIKGIGQRVGVEGRGKRPSETRVAEFGAMPPRVAVAPVVAMGVPGFRGTRPCRLR